jgi:hypothetical protein
MLDANNTFQTVPDSGGEGLFRGGNGMCIGKVEAFYVGNVVLNEKRHKIIASLLQAIYLFTMIGVIQSHGVYMVVVLGPGPRRLWFGIPSMPLTHRGRYCHPKLILSRQVLQVD